MKTSLLIAKLQELQTKHGDLPVYITTDTGLGNWCYTVEHVPVEEGVEADPHFEINIPTWFRSQYDSAEMLVGWSDRPTDAATATGMYDHDDVN